MLTIVLCVGVSHKIQTIIRFVLTVVSMARRVMVELIPVQDFKVIRVDIAIKAIMATKVVIINRGINNNSRRVIRATRSS